jgi:ectoine hydroxylase-related dioxygenase (phytanoyl-CoA dioxygenase family)
MSAPASTTRLEPAQRERFASDGYLALPGLVSRAWLDEVGAIVAAHQARGRFEVMPPASGDLFVIQALSERAPELRRHFRTGPVAWLAREILGPEIRLLSNRYLVKPPGGHEIFPWHRDREEYANVATGEGITLWIPMADVDRANGCLWYVPGSHRAEEGAAAPPPVCVPMQRGDVAVHTMGTLHMSGRNRTEAPRAVVALEYIRADAIDPATGRRFEHAALIEP